MPQIQTPKFETDIVGKSLGILGHVHLESVPGGHHKIGTVGPNAVVVFGPFPSGSWEFRFFDNAQLPAGTPENIYVAAGDSTITDAPIADAMLLDASQCSTWYYHFIPAAPGQLNQTHLAFRTTAAGAKTIAIYARRIR